MEVKWVLVQVNQKMS